MDPNLDLLRRIAAKLPPGVLRRKLDSVIAGLATPAHFASSEGQLLHRETHIDDARRVLSTILPELRKALPSDQDVADLDGL